MCFEHAQTIHDCICLFKDEKHWGQWRNIELIPSIFSLFHMTYPFTLSSKTTGIDFETFNSLLKQKIQDQSAFKADDDLVVV